MTTKTLAALVLLAIITPASADGPIDPVRVTTQTIVRETPPELREAPLLTPPPPSQEAALSRLFGFPVTDEVTSPAAGAVAGAIAVGAAATGTARSACFSVGTGWFYIDDTQTPPKPMPCR